MSTNFASGTVWTGDNLPVMRGMNDASVDLIYLDPPFNSNRHYEAPIGSKAAGAAFKDAWTLDDIDVHEHGELADRNPAAYAVIEAARQASGKGMQSYLIFMAVRLLEMHRVLKPTGSIYLRCDPTASHYLKLLMDGIFGRGNFLNEIAWCYKSGGVSKRWFARKHDSILLYGRDSGAHTFNPIKVKSYGQTGGGQGGKVKYYRDSKGTYSLVNARDWWEISMLSTTHSERLGYPTQKPLALLDRIVAASSNEGDMILDPFCGCATALVAADRLQRRWAGIDLSALAVKLVDERISGERGMWGGVTVPDGPPKRTDLGEFPNYRTHRHRLYGEQEGICVGCETHFPFRVMDVDHIMPRVKGGTDHPDNLQLYAPAATEAKGVGQWPNGGPLNDRRSETRRSAGEAKKLSADEGGDRGTVRNPQERWSHANARGACKAGIETGKDRRRRRCLNFDLETGAGIEPA